MKKSIIGFITLLFFTSAYAELSTSVAVTSDYVWRGVSQSATSPAVQGSASYSHGFLEVGTWMSSLSGSNSGAEVDVFAILSHSFTKDFKLSLSATNYIYTRNSNGSFMEYAILGDNPWLNFMVAYTNEYAGAKTSGMYYNVSRGFTLSEAKKLDLTASFGMSSFDKEALAGQKDYMDWKLAFVKGMDSMSFEIFYSGTDRKGYDGTSETLVKDSTLGVTFTHNL